MNNVWKTFIVCLLFIVTGCGVSGVEAVNENTSQGTIFGSVKDATNYEPIEGVEVEILGRFRILNSVIDVPVAIAYTDANGNFTISNIPSGTYTIRFKGDRYISAHGIVNVESNKTKNYPMVLLIPSNSSGLSTITGKILDALTGNALSGVSIGVFKGIEATTGELIYQANTDQTGNFSLELEE